LIGGWWLFQRCASTDIRGSPAIVFRGPIRLHRVSRCCARCDGRSSAPPPVAILEAASIALGAGILLVLGHWWVFWPMHTSSNWKKAAAATNQLSLGPETPVIYPSPFIEAKPPAWRPDIPARVPLRASADLSGPRQGVPVPFESSPPAEEFAIKLAKEILPSEPRFFILWRRPQCPVLARLVRPRQELAGWTNRRLGPFGDVEVVLFESRQRETRAQSTAHRSSHLIRSRPVHRIEYS